MLLMVATLIAFIITYIMYLVGFNYKQEDAAIRSILLAVWVGAGVLYDEVRRLGND